MMTDIDPGAWKDATRAKVKATLAAMIESGNVPDDGLWAGRVRDGENVLFGLCDQVMLAVVDTNPVLLTIYPRGMALAYMKKDFTSAAQNVLRRNGFDMFPVDEGGSHSGGKSRWHFARLPAQHDTADRVERISEFYRLRAAHREAMADSYSAGSRHDTEQAEHWHVEAARRRDDAVAGGGAAE